MRDGPLPAVEIHPLTPDRWGDFETLFGPNGAVAGCWCMWFRQTSREFDKKHGEPNRLSMRAIVDSGRAPGLLAYVEGRPVGWCSVAPRSEFGRIERSRILRAAGGESAWAVVCFFIHRAHRGRGVGEALLRAAVTDATERGARIVEGYPLDPGAGRANNGAAFVGVAAMFREAGFVEVGRHSPGRPIMRYTAG